ncbi:hypothetical protein CYMTET_16250 [Cymbomonas tetramitiformis]|uniref:Uncharacterized protein n=1 Tax=Cymbomonas tetramitiformis TaxID=36881 RepID=A0AAE0L8I7_9CHLO|nr:hypothetical protein CYMTET_16250 [Cymbomonas tetramitiformis]
MGKWRGEEHEEGEGKAFVGVRERPPAPGARTVNCDILHFDFHFQREINFLRFWCFSDRSVKKGFGQLTPAMRKEQKKNHGRLPGGKVVSTVLGKARIGFTGAFLKAKQGKAPKGQRGGKKGGNKK